MSVGGVDVGQDRAGTRRGPGDWGGSAGWKIEGGNLILPRSAATQPRLLAHRINFTATLPVCRRLRTQTVLPDCRGCFKEYRRSDIAAHYRIYHESRYAHRTRIKGGLEKKTRKLLIPLTRRRLVSRVKGTVAAVLVDRITTPRSNGVGQNSSYLRIIVKSATMISQRQAVRRIERRI